MSQDALTFLSGFFVQIWRLLTGFYIPGTRLTPAALIVGQFIINAFIILFGKLFNNVSLNGSKEENENEKKESE